MLASLVEDGAMARGGDVSSLQLHVMSLIVADCCCSVIQYRAEGVDQQGCYGGARPAVAEKSVSEVRKPRPPPHPPLPLLQPTGRRLLHRGSLLLQWNYMQQWLFSADKTVDVEATINVLELVYILSIISNAIVFRVVCDRILMKSVARYLLRCQINAQLVNIF